MLPVAIVALVGGFYGFQSWQDGQYRAAQRRQLLVDVREALAAESADKDLLGDLMAGLVMLDGAATAPDLLAAQAEIELLRGRPDRAYRLFGAIAESPDASVGDRRLAARIQIARQDGYAGDAATSQSMLQQIATFSELAYADSGSAEDAFRAWQAWKRLWDHERAARLAGQLAERNADSKEQKLVALSSSFDPQRDAVAVEDLLIDFEDRIPAELAALRTTVLLGSNKVPGALKQAEQDLNRFAGVGGVRYALAIVLHACGLGSPEGSLDRASFLKRRDEQLDWLLKRAPESEKLRQQWQQLRAFR